MKFDIFPDSNVHQSEYFSDSPNTESTWNSRVYFQWSSGDYSIDKEYNSVQRKRKRADLKRKVLTHKVLLMVVNFRSGRDDDDRKLLNR